MATNQILHVQQNKATELIKHTEKEDWYIVNIHGNSIQTKNDFLELMKEEFLLPDCSGWDSFIDWMTDLSWIDRRCFCIVINDYENFLKEDNESKEIIIEIFEEDILPFWEKDVMKTVVNGEPRTFKLYLVVP
ncbi:Barstar (barnase inhibitor) [Amphibacillus marinus]|uniref:Barstar (Barnase inhibitor) n=1 Tax=Amphibacillus marinus TaxID=872970 RepID=A0A1H8TTR4_9BACI|nr:barstar family protein [Amphibacillus marinus]SEO94389.1 Barstar (barnase inhibitor) [Amphibacillus marinus]